jgi:KDO2-lipid IV(A) lauroyltransferase
MADLCYWRSPKDRQTVRANLSVIQQTQDVSPVQVREVFHNFGMYLVDFFRFSQLTPEKIRHMVRCEGLERMESALAQGRGAIGLTAHLGNYELAAAVLALLGFPVHALVLTHRDPRVNAFFTRQRERVGVKGIPLSVRGARETFLSSCEVLRRNQILGIVGDRDFSNDGLSLSLFGRPVQIPKGPAFFSLKTGAPILPVFMVRQPDQSYRFILEAPLPSPSGVSRKEAERSVTQAYVDLLARYIRQYPTQWYMFQEFWRPAPAVVI